MPTRHKILSYRARSSGERSIIQITELGISIQPNIEFLKVAESHLLSIIRLQQERKWRSDHADFVSAYNSTIEDEGLPLEKWNSFL